MLKLYISQVIESLNILTIVHFEAVEVLAGLGRIISRTNSMRNL